MARRCRAMFPHLNELNTKYKQQVEALKAALHTDDSE